VGGEFFRSQAARKLHHRVWSRAITAAAPVAGALLAQTPCARAPHVRPFPIHDYQAYMCRFPTVNNEMAQPDAFPAAFQNMKFAALAPCSASRTMTSHKIDADTS